MTDPTLQHIDHLLKNSQIFECLQYLQTLPPKTAVPNKAQLIQELQGKRDAAAALTADINVILDNGDYRKALKQLKGAQGLVSDFPNIQTDIDFITSSISILEKTIEKAELLAGKGQKQEVDKLLKTIQNIDKNHPALYDVNQTLIRSQRKKKAYAITIAALIFILPLVYFSFEQITIQQANSLWQKADIHINNQQLEEAGAIIEQMQSRLKFVHLSGQSEKIRLLNFAANSSQTTLPVLQDQKNTTPTQRNGNKNYIQTIIMQAKNTREYNLAKTLNLYDDALDFSKDNIHIDEDLIKQIKAKRSSIQQSLLLQDLTAAKELFQAKVKRADDLFRNDKWQDATTAYQHALAFAKNNNLSDIKLMTHLKSGYTTAFINSNLAEGEIALKQKRYENAESYFQNCLNFMEEMEKEDEILSANLTAKLQTTRQKQLMVQLLNMVKQGDQLFMEAEYQLSLNHYQDGLNFIAENENSMIDKEATHIQKRLHKKITQAKKKTLVLTQTRHLAATYKKILRQNFNLSRNINFNRPQIVFLGNQDHYLVYMVSAFGAKSKVTAPIKYEIAYKFDIKTGKWDIKDSRLEV